MELMAEYNSLLEANESVDVVVKVALEIIPFFLKHNAEADACDLLLELEQVDKLVDFVDKNTFERVCLYILRYIFFKKFKKSCVPFVTPPDDISILKTAHAIYCKMSRYPQALQVALKLNDQELIQSDFSNCPDS